MKKTLIVSAFASFFMGLASQASAVPQPQVANLPAQVNAVPEPATWAMMIIGIAVLGLALRRRQRRAA